MAKTKSVTVGIGRKISDNNYGSVDFFVSETVDLEEGDDREEEFVKVYKRCKKRGSKAMKELRKAVGADD